VCCSVTLHRLLARESSHCNTLQHAVTHCNTLQHIATHFNTLQHTGIAPPRGLRHCNTLRNSTPHYASLQIAPDCTTLQHAATHCIALLWRLLERRDTATHCNTLHHTAPHCTTLHHTTPHRRLLTAGSSLKTETLRWALRRSSSRSATHCNKQQHPATPCNALQHPATLRRLITQRTLVFAVQLLREGSDFALGTAQKLFSLYNTLLHTATQCNTPAFDNGAAPPRGRRFCIGRCAEAVLAHLPAVCPAVTPLLEL